jgi:hypothetical protein
LGLDYLRIRSLAEEHGQAFGSPMVTSWAALTKGVGPISC